MFDIRPLYDRFTYLHCVICLLIRRIQRTFDCACYQ